jgi:phage terminase large subunit
MIIGAADKDSATSAGVELLNSWADNPGAAAFDCFSDPSTASGRLELQPHQIDVMRRVFEGADVTWRAGHGVGKTTTLAVLVILYLILKPFSKVPTTAPTWHQVRNVLWTEIAKWYERFRFKSFFTLDKTKLSMNYRPAEWFAIGIASNRQENIEGFHAARLLYVVEEAKGVRDQIYDGIDGACTEGGQRIYASTPGSRFGKFYQSHHGRISSLFSVVHTNGETAPRVSKKWVDLKKLEWGTESPIYIAKVRGEFPQEGDDVLYPLDFIDEAVAAFLEVDDAGEPVVKHATHYAIGCDVARFGFNKTVAIGGSKNRLDRLTSWERKPTTETTARLIALKREIETNGRSVDVVAIDDSGLGGGVTDQLREAGYTVDAVLFGGSPTDDGREFFANKKAEMAWELRKALDANRAARLEGKSGTFGLLPDERLQGQLAALRRRYGGKGVLSIVDPDDPSIPASELAPGMKVSPDHAHAAILAYYGATTASTLGVGAVIHPDPVEKQRLQRRLSSYIMGGGRGPGRR